MNQFTKEIDYALNIKKECNFNQSSIKVESIPMCNSCLFEIKEGVYVCFKCKQNLCLFHKNEHLKQYSDHELSELSINK
jgi:hypothetical protein